jgi:hypothetical protein
LLRRFALESISQWGPHCRHFSRKPAKNYYRQDAKIAKRILFFLNVLGVLAVEEA